MLALAGPIDDAAHHGDRHVLDARVVFAPFGHAVAQVRLDALRELLEKAARGAAASGTRDDHRREGAQPHGLQDLLRDEHLLRAIAAGLGRERHAHRVADALLQHDGHAGGRGHDALRSHARFGQAQVQRVVAARREVAVDRDEILHAAHLRAQDDVVVRQAELLGALRRSRAPTARPHAASLPAPSTAAACALFSSIRRVSRSWSRLPQLTPMRTGLLVAAGGFDHLRELRVALAATADVARVDAVLGERRGAVRMLTQQLVAVEVKVADERHVHPHLRRGAARIGATAAAAALVLTVMRTSSEPARASDFTCCAVASASSVSVLVIDCTTMGCAPPTRTRADLHCNAAAPLRASLVHHRQTRGLPRGQAPLAVAPHVHAHVDDLHLDRQAIHGAVYGD